MTHETDRQAPYLEMYRDKDVIDSVIGPNDMEQVHCYGGYRNCETGFPKQFYWFEVENLLLTLSVVCTVAR